MTDRKSDAINAVHAAEAALTKARANLADIEEREREAYADRMREGLTPAFIDLIAPEHDGRDCSDHDMKNHAVHAPRQTCLRCFLLHAHQSHYWPDEVQLEIRLNVLRPVER